MSSMTDMLQEHLGENGLAQLTQHLGIDPSTAQAAAAAALPMLVSAMSRTPSQPGAAPVPPGAGGSSAGGLLGNLLGGNHAELSQQVSKTSGLDIHQAEKALLFLAPIVMAQLARKRETAAPATAGVAPQPPSPQGQPEPQAPGAGGLLGAVERMLHRDS